MKPRNWTLGLLICLFWPSVSARAQDSTREQTESAPALTITAYIRSALIAQMYDSQGQLENSVTSLGTVEKSVLTFDLCNDADLILKTPEGFLYLRRIEILVRFSGFRNEMGSINLSAPGPLQSVTTTLVEGPSPESVVRVDPSRRKLVSDAMRNGDRFVRYVGFFVSLPSDITRPEPAKCQFSYEVGVP